MASINSLVGNIAQIDRRAREFSVKPALDGGVVRVPPTRVPPLPSAREM